MTRVEPLNSHGERREWKREGPGPNSQVVRPRKVHSTVESDNKARVA